MKKYTLILLAAILVAAITILPVFATTGGAAASEVVSAVGQTADVIVSVYGCANVESMAIEFAVPDGLTLESAQWILGGTVTDVDLDRKRAVWTNDDPQNMTENTEVFKLTFRVDALSEGADLEKRINLSVMVDTTDNGRTTYAATGKLTVSAPAQYVTLNHSEVTLDLNGTLSEILTGTIQPAYTTDTLQWESDNTEVAIVDANGQVTAVGAGTATITASAGDAYAQCRVKVICSHTGGTATCIDKAICEICEAKYGNVDQTNHAGQEKWTYSTSTHKKAYDCCGQVVVAEENHDWKDGVCSQCGYGCNHTGGTATCQEQAICSKCDRPYGELNEENHTGEVVWSKNANKHSKKYTCCGKVTVESEKHTWQDGVCGVCGYVCDHSSGVNVKNAVAANCYQSGYSGDRYCKSCSILVVAGSKLPATGNHVAPADWLTTEECHWHMCATKGCGTVLDLEYHNFQWVIDKVPTAQETGMKHEQCQICQLKKESVEIPVVAGTHTNVTYHAAVAATCVQTGTVEYWTCDCEQCAGKYFADEACQVELETIETAVDSQNHSGQVSVKNAAEATCDAEGYTGDSYCADCDVLISRGESIEKTQHTPIRVDAKEATCTQDGALAHFRCENCGRYYAVENEQMGAEITAADVVLKATGHSYAEAWCSDAEGHWQVCHCGHKTEAAQHDGSVVGAVEATKENAGYTGDTICQVCGYEMAKGQVIPQLPQSVLDAVENAQPGATVEIEITKEDGTLETVVSAAILQAARDKQVNLILDLGAYQWVISGEQIGDAEMQDVDLKVKLDTQNIPAGAVTDVAGTDATMQFEVMHNGQLGFQADLIIDVGTKYAGVTCEVYRYSDAQQPMARSSVSRELELVGSYTIGADGKMTAQVSSGGDYLVVFDAEDLNSPETGSANVAWLVLAAGIAAAGATMLIGKKKETLDV